MVELVRLVSVVVNDRQILAGVELDSALRRSAKNGDRSVEVYVERNDGESEAAAEARVRALLPRLETVLRRLPQIARQAVDVAPSDWRSTMTAAPEIVAAERLFCDGVEVDGEGVISVVLYDDDLVYVELVAVLNSLDEVDRIELRQL